MRTLRAIPAVSALAGAAGHGQRPHAAAGAAGHLLPAVEVHDRRAGGHRRRALRHQGKGVHLPRRLPEPRRDAGAADRDQHGDRPISLRDARILFETAAGDRIQAAEPEDVERLMTRKEREGGKIPLPGPCPPSKLSPRPATRRSRQDFDNFEYRALVVEPHTTRAGFLFYDVSGARPSARAAPSCTCASCATPTATSCSTSRFPSTSTCSRSRAR